LLLINSGYSHDFYYNFSASEMTYTASDGALNSTHSPYYKFYPTPQHFCLIFKSMSTVDSAESHDALYCAEYVQYFRNNTYTLLSTFLKLSEVIAGSWI